MAAPLHVATLTVKKSYIIFSIYGLYPPSIATKNKSMTPLHVASILGLYLIPLLQDETIIIIMSPLIS